MALVQDGPLKGFCVPEYDGGSIVNLMASIIRSRNGASPHADLECLPARELADSGKVIYCVVDGVGVHQLRRFLDGGRGGSFFACHPFSTITSVFPATTAAAATTLATGASPAEHGMLGWFVHLHDLGIVSAALPVTTRTGVPAVPDDFDLQRYLDMPRHLDSTEGRRAFLAFGDIASSRYSRSGTRWTHTGSFDTLRGMEHQAADFARGRQRGVAYVYWPTYDMLCHDEGTQATVTIEHLADIDASLGRLARSIEGTDTHLLVVADHGLEDTPPHRSVCLRDLPGFYDCLTTTPAGDARQVSCFVRPRREQAFLDLVASQLADCCVCLPGEELMGLGVFGPGKPHRSLSNRLGDYVLLSRDDYAFTYPLADYEPHAFVGNHGGMGEDEMLVPLYAMRL